MTTKNEVKTPTVKDLAIKTNAAIKQVEKTEGTLFKIVRECVAEILEKEDAQKCLSQYKNGIETSHRSTVFVMIKVATNEKLTKLANELPKSYMTLYECHKLLEEHPTEFADLVGLAGQ